MRQEAWIGLVACALLAACATPVDIAPDDVALVGDAAAPDAHSQKSDASSYPVADSGAPDPGNADPDAGSSVTADSGSSSACASPFTGTLVTFDFTGDPGNQASTAPKTTVAGITAASLTRSGSLTAVTGASSINASNWSTAAKPDATRYYAFTLTPDPNCALDLTSLSIDSTSSSTGPAKGAVATSDDQFATTAAFTAGAPTKVTLSVSQATKAVEVRVYGFNASGASGTMRLQTTLSLSGALN
ncbi:MAG TPA: hypothetical protein VF316_21465 [Polyangiaceae bacterium]